MTTTEPLIQDIAEAMVDSGPFDGLTAEQQTAYLRRAERIAGRLAERIAEVPAQPATVVQALHAVMRDLPGIGKDQQSEQGYQYRGIEAITRHTQALFGKYGITIIPEVIERRVKDLVINSRPWTEDELHVLYRAYGPAHGTVRTRRVLSADGNNVLEIDEVVDDMVTIGPLIGLGRDNSDKGCNKSMTQCLKYALIQTLCIGDGKDDADAGPANEADPVRSPGWQQRENLRVKLTGTQPGMRAMRDAFREFLKEQGFPAQVHDLNDEQLQAAEAFVASRQTADRIHAEAMTRLTHAGVTAELLTKPAGMMTDAEANLLQEVLRGPDADAVMRWMDSLKPAQPAPDRDDEGRALDPAAATGAPAEDVPSAPAVGEAGEAVQEALLGAEPAHEPTRAERAQEALAAAQGAAHGLEVGEEDMAFVSSTIPPDSPIHADIAAEVGGMKAAEVDDWLRGMGYMTTGSLTERKGRLRWVRLIAEARALVETAREEEE